MIKKSTIENEFPLRVGDRVKTRVGEGPYIETKHLKVISIHKWIFQAEDVKSGVVYGFPKVDWFTGVVTRE